MRGRFAGGAAALCFLLGACTTASMSSTPRQDQRLSLLRETLSAHVTAIQNRDLDALLATVTTGDSLVLIFPSGTMTTTRQEYADFHRRWFADSEWTMHFEPVSHLLGGELGIVLLRTEYRSASGSWNGLLTLTFRHEAGRYRLVFDQNTRVERP